MAQLLSSMSKDERFSSPWMVDLRQGVQSDLNGTLLTQAQLLALTLNELCALVGRVLFAWLPDYAHNDTVRSYDEEPWHGYRTDAQVNCLPDMFWLNKQWTANEKNEYWGFSQTERLKNVEGMARLIT